MKEGLHIVYFAWLRDRIGRNEEHVPLPPGVANVGGLITWLRGRGRDYKSALATENRIRCAVNHEVAALDTPISPGDEVGFFPPITGG
ncbi:molybdopterin converting factor subunit 1 [Granulibacter bethesdensis]|uniref:Molybdopterin converting factor, small subunit n=2 Tax=Granulibacter bethesdensis TaxID=364410 RepID=Q0BQB8_GRABC|nr:molybdopterin converting factor subunit 1 [Granulibacter bethesdensis]ABI62984.1 Molybdopterin converting factor, small subunit [Granulibacter bethesdensis CGDNIH1]AHJ63979.1 Molybdopterin converting factor, small subunit [Granulibacter bethesdensis]AHJ65440.1 Molybdopterin converting factor, small subunit [Granulibacter bethesdensis CGDNIH4]AHJ68053.1 Molybdopterin converting factor, small subunit [Granulibacter bethesdensis]APH52854.1 Molybdopterin converting factor, small subunit [Granul